MRTQNACTFTCTASSSKNGWRALRAFSYCAIPFVVAVAVASVIVIVAVTGAPVGAAAATRRPRDLGNRTD
jgi:hypothetical protein